MASRLRTRVEKSTLTLNPKWALITHLLECVMYDI